MAAARDAADLALVVAAAAEGGAEAMRYRARGGGAVREKPGGAGPVSEGDLAVNAVLEARLRGARPAYGWLSEESADDPARLAAGRVFIVDPIDGTRAYLAGDPAFAISVAVVEGGRAVAGAVHLPALGLSYAATAGGPATLNGAVLGPLEGAGLDGIEVLARRGALDPAHWPGGVPPVRRAFRASLAWRLCLVAEGRFGAMLTLAPAWEWDIAAGALIAERAGARVSDGAGAALRFNVATPRLGGVIAAPPGVHAALLARRRAG